MHIFIYKYGTWLHLSAKKHVTNESRGRFGVEIKEIITDFKRLQQIHPCSRTHTRTQQQICNGAHHIAYVKVNGAVQATKKKETLAEAIVFDTWMVCRDSPNVRYYVSITFTF